MLWILRFQRPSLKEENESNGEGKKTDPWQEQQGERIDRVNSNDQINNHVQVQGSPTRKCQGVSKLELRQLHAFFHLG